jgi:hypothetical protein
MHAGRGESQTDTPWQGSFSLFDVQSAIIGQRFFRSFRKGTHDWRGMVVLWHLVLEGAVSTGNREETDDDSEVWYLDLQA